MKTSKELLGARIRKIRKERGLTQEQLAEMVDIEQKHVSRIEVGKNYPTIDRLVRIAKALDVPIMSLFDFWNRGEVGERASTIEDMLKELDESFQKTAFKVIRGVIKSLKEE